MKKILLTTALGAVLASGSALAGNEGKFYLEGGAGLSRPMEFKFGTGEFKPLNDEWTSLDSYFFTFDIGAGYYLMDNLRVGVKGMMPHKMELFANKAYENKVPQIAVANGNVTETTVVTKLQAAHDSLITELGSAADTESAAITTKVGALITAAKAKYTGTSQKTEYDNALDAMKDDYIAKKTLDVANKGKFYKKGSFTDTKIYALLANATFTLLDSDGWKVFGGAGVGASSIETVYNSYQSISTEKPEEVVEADKHSFVATYGMAFNVNAGVSYEVAPGVDLALKAQYTNYGSLPKKYKLAAETTEKELTNTDLPSFSSWGPAIGLSIAF